jgi:anti-sigma factor RsiW
MEADVNRNIEEQLSAFLDGELRKEELELLVRRLERDDQYRATLARYSLIGNIVRKDPVQTYPKRFRTGVMDAIAVDSSPPVVTEKQLPFLAQWKMPFVSAAAILLLFGAISSVGLFDSVTGSGEQLRQVVSAGAPAISNPAVSAGLANKQRDGAVRVRQAALNPQRLTSYMVSHREYSKPLHGPIANSRIVIQQARFEE